MTLQEEKPMDRPYIRPQLVIYGDIQEITQAVASNSKTSDSGSGMTNKTS